jgi:hypothetical protein
MSNDIDDYLLLLLVYGLLEGFELEFDIDNEVINSLNADNLDVSEEIFFPDDLC